MANPQKEIAKVSVMGKIAIVIGAALAAFFIYQVVAINNEIDTKYVGEFMMSAADDMSELQSQAGNSIAEAYYQNHGNYLLGEAKIYNASIIIDIRRATAQSLIGFILSLGLVMYGSTLKIKKA